VQEEEEEEGCPEEEAVALSNGPKGGVVRQELYFSLKSTWTPPFCLRTVNACAVHSRHVGFDCGSFITRLQEK